MKKALLTLVVMLFAIYNYGQTCTPTFTLSQSSPQGNSLLNVSLTLTANIPSSPNVRHYKVYWGDGTISNSTHYVTNTHQYSSPGTYTVKVILTRADSSMNNITCIDSATSNITLAYGPCATSISTNINTQNNGQVTFTANTPAGTSNMTYVWIFGDGTADTTTNTSVTHTYSYSANFLVQLVAHNSGSQCVYTNYTNVQVLNGCGHASFTHTANGLISNFQNTSSYVNGYLKIANAWNFGDGNTSNQNYPTHIYAAPGTYNVQLITTWGDSTTHQVYCRDTTIQPVTVTGSSSIHGYILTDSNVLAQPAFKVWLITYDSSTQTLSAIDSLVIPSLGVTHTWRNYQFNNVPQGTYRVKAAVTNGPTTGTGYVPTYHDSDLLWSNANTINHITGNTTGKWIKMRSGTITTGPGFVAGNVTQGANKGTSGGIQGMEIYLLDANNQLMQSAITDASGSFSFSQIPNGTYKVHPEQMNYTTTDASITIANGQASYNGINFERSHSQKTITPKPVGIANIYTNNIDFSIYPNPTKGVINIELNTIQQNSKANIQVSDVTGKNIQSSITDKSKTTLNLSSLQKGLYFITIKVNNHQRTEKLLIQ